MVSLSQQWESGTVNSKYNIEFSRETVQKNLIRIVNLTYKLLPIREEGGDWQKPLETILEELVGLNRLIKTNEKLAATAPNQEPLLFSLLCKLEGLFALDGEESFQLYRRTIFECLSLMNEMVDKWEN